MVPAREPAGGYQAGNLAEMALTQREMVIFSYHLSSK
jgi:hypothetical protein